MQRVTGLSLPVLGDFELLRELGRGGMGIVYEAPPVSPNRKVAPKVLKAGLSLTTQAVDRFRRTTAAELHRTRLCIHSNSSISRLTQPQNTRCIQTCCV